MSGRRAAFTRPMSSEDDLALRARLLAIGLAILRIIFGLILFTNGLSKLTNGGLMHLHPLPGFLIDYNGAKGIIQANVQHHPIGIYKRFILDVVVPHWTLFGVLVTIGELSTGLGLILGAFTPLMALAAALMTFHIYFSTWGGGDGYFVWDYWTEFIPYLALALASAGRYYGLDTAIARRWPALRRWPIT